MSFQDTQSGTPISIVPESELQRCRLLELPADLLALITSEHPPTLQLKSQDALDATTTDAHLVLCTPDKTYNVRQVSTSNSVYLTQPTPNGRPTQTEVHAVSKCDSTLELIATDRQSAVPFIKAALPVYSSTGNYGSSKAMTKSELFSHIPLSQAECEAAWSALACFESPKPAGCFIPSASVRAQIWETALTAATAEGADLKDAFIADDIPPFALDMRQDWPVQLLAAIFAAISSTTPGGNLSIDEGRCVRFVGLSQLEAKSAGRATDKVAFLKAWKDAVPEAWREKCDLSVLQGSYALRDGGSSIAFTEDNSSALAAGGAKEEAKTSLGAKRKWHEKFRPAKKPS